MTIKITDRHAGVIMFFCSLIIAISLNTAVGFSETQTTVAELSHEKLVEAAKLGDMEAQYRLAKLIYRGAIKGWKDLSYRYFLESAAKQGHALATYDWYSRYYNRLAEVEEKNESWFKETLNLLAKQGEGHAHYLLSSILKDQMSAQRRANIKVDKVTELRAFKHLESAYEFGSRSAADIYSMHLRRGWIIEQDLSRSLSVLQEALTMDREPSSSNDTHKSQTCNILFDIHSYYSGELTVNGVAIDTFSNKEEELKILQKGYLFSCGTLMLQLANFMLEEKGADLLEIYMLLIETLEIYEVDFSWQGAIDNVQFELGRVASRLNDFEAAKKHFAKIETEDWNEILYMRGGEAIFLCRRQNVSEENCKSFIKN